MNGSTHFEEKLKIPYFGYWRDRSRRDKSYCRL